MKTTFIATALLSAAICQGAFAKTYDLDVRSGETVSQSFHLEKNDVVMLHTYVPVGHAFFVYAASADPSEKAVSNFNFVSSVGGVNPERHGVITDRVFAGANPGWVSYTFVGEEATDAEFQVAS